MMEITERDRMDPEEQEVVQLDGAGRDWHILMRCCEDYNTTLDML